MYRLLCCLAAGLIGVPLAAGQEKKANERVPSEQLLRLSRDEAFRPVSRATLAQDAEEGKAASAPTDAATDVAAEGAREHPPGLLMEGLRAVGLGQSMDDLGISFYGWVQTSFTGVLTGPGGSRAGLPLRVYETRPDNLQMNQLFLAFERAIDTTKAFDFGWKVDQYFGTDSQVNASAGLLDQETHQHSYDLGAFYGTLWFGTGKDSGLQIDFGKWYTTIGAELMTAADNWLISRSMLFGTGPFTHTGVLARYYIDSQWNVHLGVARGWDQWNDANDGASWHAGVGYTTPDEKHAIGFNFIAGPENVGRGHPGNRYIWNVVWTAQWTEKLTGVLDAAYTFQDDAPGAFTENGVARMRDSAWWGVAYMLNYAFNEYASATGRFEYFADNHGARTGFRGHFYSVTTGMAFTPFANHTWLKDLQIRPELRWDFSDNNAPFAEDQQLTAAIDLIYKF